MPRASLIYLTYNSSADIPHLPALVGSAGEEMYVVAIDNASSDDSVQRVSDRGPAVWMNKENLGFTAAINQGLRRCDTEWALIINPDARATKEGWLADLLDVDEDVGIVGARLTDGMQVLGGGIIEPYDHPIIRPRPYPVDGGEIQCDELLGWTRLNQLRADPMAFTKARDVPWVAFAVAAIRMKMVEQIGPLDENYWHYVSDHEYCLRAWANNWRVHYRPVTFAHRGGTAVRTAPPEVEAAIRQDIARWCRVEVDYLRAAHWS